MIIPRVFGLVGLCRGFERADRQLLDAAALAGHLVTAGLHVRVPGRAPGRGVPGCGLCGPVRPPGAGQALPDAGQAGVVVVVAADVVMGSWLRRSSGRHLAGASNSSAQCGLERILELGLDQGGVQRVETKPPQTSTPSRADIWPRGPLNPITSCDDSRVAAAVTFGPSQVGPPRPGRTGSADVFGSGAGRAAGGVSIPLRFNLLCSAELIAVRLPWANSL